MENMISVGDRIRVVREHRDAPDEILTVGRICRVEKHLPDLTVGRICRVERHLPDSVLVRFIPDTGPKPTLTVAVPPEVSGIAVQVTAADGSSRVYRSHAGDIAKARESAAADEREDKLLQAEQYLIERFDRELAVTAPSAFFTGGAMEPGTNVPDGWGAWRMARARFVRTFSDADKRAMLAAVTMDNPPLARDVEFVPDRRRSYIVWHRVMVVLAVLWVLAIAVMDIITG